jgi:hypothetical protein
MPRIKYLTEMEAKDRKIAAAIQGAMVFNKKDNGQMAEAMGMTYPTWLRRVKEPGKFTIEEIRRMKRVLPGLELGI